MKNYFSFYIFRLPHTSDLLSGITLIQNDFILSRIQITKKCLWEEVASKSILNSRSNLISDIWMASPIKALYSV